MARSSNNTNTEISDIPVKGRWEGAYSPFLGLGNTTTSNQ